jgi:plastocyanin
MSLAFRRVQLVPAVILIGTLLSGCGTSTDGASHAGTEAKEPAAEIDTKGDGLKQTPHPADVTVRIDNFTFSPAKLTIAAGTKVTWINHDDVPHTATNSRKPRLFDSKTLDTDDQFSFVFTAPGTYDYFCALHKHMTAQITVK